MKPQSQNKAILVGMAFFIFIAVLWLFVLMAQTYYPGQNLIEILIGLNRGLADPLHLAWTSQTPRFLGIGALVYLLLLGIYLSGRKHKRPGEEQGSAKWGDAGSINRKYRGRRHEPEIILTRRVRLGMDTRRHRRNLHALVIGGSGSGKTRFFSKPNIMQTNCSYIITDPKGELLKSTGALLKAQGYEVKVLDLINKQHSFGYNPFIYLRSDSDIMKLITNLIRNTTPKGSNANDPFWEKSEMALLTALMLYLWHEAPTYEQNWPMVMEMLQYAGVGGDDDDDDDEDQESPLDILFRRLEQRSPGHIACRYYKIYKMAAGKTAKSILISVGVRLGAFLMPDIARIMRHDELDIGSLGEKKTALFCLIPDNDTTFNFLVGMLYTQAFQELYHKADYECDGRLPIHVRCVMDEFANVALPDDFDKILATCRSREISINIIIQNLAQLKALFKDSWESIVGNCDTMIYLGSNEKGIHKEVSEMLGKATIDTNTYGRTRGRQGSFSTNDQQHGRELMMPDEVRILDNDHALLFLRGERPVLDLKYDILKHPRIKAVQDGGAAAYRYERERGNQDNEYRFKTYKGLDPTQEFDFIESEDLSYEDVS